MQRLARPAAFLSVLILGLAANAQAQERFILQAENLEEIRSEVALLRGKVERKMDVVHALVSNLPAGAIHALLIRNPHVKAFADRELHLVKYSSQGKTSTTVQPAQSIQWGLNAISARQANLINRGQGVKVCIVDTGISRSHPDLQANIAGGKNFVWSKGWLNTLAYEDDNGHGSHVAGVVAALDNSIGTIGVAPLASLYAVKVLNRQGSGRLSDIADGVHACRIAGAHVINMSLGGNGDPTVDDPFKIAVDQAVAAGIVVVVAAGNEGQDIKNTTPAGFSNVIAVAASNSAGGIPSWSNFGLRPSDMTGPGVSIYSTWLGTGYNTISGTSMASPHVAGVVALKISSGSALLKAKTLGLPLSRQGAGLVDALGTVSN